MRAKNAALSAYLPNGGASARPLRELEALQGSHGVSLVLSRCLPGQLRS